MDNPKLIVVGSVAYDTIHTPAESQEDVLGGSATYFSLAARTLVETGIVAVVGTDFRKQDRALLEGKGVNCRGLTAQEGLTFRWGGRYDADLKERETLFTALNVFADFAPKLPNEFKGVEVLFLANIDPELQLAVLSQCHGPRWVACDTMNFWIKGKLPALLNLLPRIDALFLNDSEALELTGHRNILKAARWIQEHGPATVIVKKGEHGAILIHEGEAFAVPALLLEAVADPTGAGDSFAGGMVGSIARMGEVSFDALKLAAAVGTVTASFCVEAFGPSRLAELDLAGIRERLAEWRKLTALPALELP
jgi:sugar/nucleoside kinase (ribokinase family)